MKKKKKGVGYVLSDSGLVPARTREKKKEGGKGENQQDFEKGNVKLGAAPPDKKKKGSTKKKLSITHGNGAFRRRGSEKKDRYYQQRVEKLGREPRMKNNEAGPRKGGTQRKGPGTGICIGRDWLFRQSRCERGLILEGLPKV